VQKKALGIRGHLNLSGNAGNITRFGWKAQNPSGFVFDAEAYNVEMGFTNEGFPNERETNPACQFAQIPNDTTSASVPSDVELFAHSRDFWTNRSHHWIRLSAPAVAPVDPVADTVIAVTLPKYSGACIGCAIAAPIITRANTTVHAQI